MPTKTSSATPLLQLDGIRKYFPLKTIGPDGQREQVRAVDGISLQVQAGETLAIVGESGCGKSTIARLMVHLLDADEGEVRMGGQRVGARDGLPLRQFRQQVQMVFQDSYSSLNPRMTLEQAIAFGLRVNGVDKRDAAVRAQDALRKVGLDPALYANRFPHELSGGQRQRVNIARALAMRPRVIVLDESVSALDKTVEAQVLALLEALRRDLGLTYVFITHDLNVVEHIADRVAVMYLGRVVECGPVEQVFNAPQHPYTLGLLRSRLSMDPDRRLSSAPLSGDPPNPIHPPPGCRFHTRCARVTDACKRVDPVLRAVGGDAQTAACHVPAAEVERTEACAT